MSSLPIGGTLPTLNSMATDSAWSDSRSLLFRFNMLHSVGTKSNDIPNISRYFMSNVARLSPEEQTMVVDAAKLLRQYYKSNSWRAALPLSIPYTILFLVLFVGSIISLVFAIVYSYTPIYFVIPGALFGTLLVSAVLFTTVLPFIITNPLQKRVLRDMREKILGQEIPQRFPLLTSAGDGPVQFKLHYVYSSEENKKIDAEERKRREEAPPEPTVQVNATLQVDEQQAANAKRRKKGGSSCFGGCCSGPWNCDCYMGSGDGAIGVLILIFILVLFTTLICVCTGVSVLDVLIDRDGAPSGVWLEVWTVKQMQMQMQMHGEHPDMRQHQPSYPGYNPPPQEFANMQLMLPQYAMHPSAPPPYAPQQHFAQPPSPYGMQQYFPQQTQQYPPMQMQPWPQQGPGTQQQYHGAATGYPVSYQPMQPYGQKYDQV